MVRWQLQDCATAPKASSVINQLGHVIQWHRCNPVCNAIVSANKAHGKVIRKIMACHTLNPSIFLLSFCTQLQPGQFFIISSQWFIVINCRWLRNPILKLAHAAKRILHNSIMLNTVTLACCLSLSHQSLYKNCSSLGMKYPGGRRTKDNHTLVSINAFKPLLFQTYVLDHLPMINIPFYTITVSDHILSKNIYHLNKFLSLNLKHDQLKTEPKISPCTVYLYLFIYLFLFFFFYFFGGRGVCMKNKV